MSKQLENVMYVLLLIASGYLFVSFGTYRLMHPDLTETQLFLHIFDALLWR